MISCIEGGSRGQCGSKESDHEVITVVERDDDVAGPKMVTLEKFKRWEVVGLMIYIHI